MHPPARPPCTATRASTRRHGVVSDRRDRLFERPQDLVDFRFDADVVDVFPDMIRRSVPGYETAVTLSAWLASRHLSAGARCYDLGCSLLATSLALSHWGASASPHIVAVDNSAAMIERAHELLVALRDAGQAPDIELVEADIEDVAIEDAAAVVMNFTLQFVAPGRRAALLQGIRRGLRADGALVVSEKLLFDDAAEQDYLEAAHLDFKRANGYSDTEIDGKRTALENVMQPDTEARLRARLQAAGFTRVYTWFRCLNWISVIALP